LKLASCYCGGLCGGQVETGKYPMMGGFVSWRKYWVIRQIQLVVFPIIILIKNSLRGD